MLRAWGTAGCIDVGCRTYAVEEGVDRRPKRATSSRCRCSCLSAQSGSAGKHLHLWFPDLFLSFESFLQMMLWLGNTMFLGGCCLLACPRHKRKVEIDGSTSLLRLLVQFSMLYMAVFKDNQIMFEGHYDLSLKKNALLCLWIANWVIYV